MSLIPHSVFPRKMMDMDSWMKPSQLWGDSSLIKPGSLMGPSSLDMFDPFDELDTLMGRDINWLSKPEFLPAVQPRVQQKVNYHLFEITQTIINNFNYNSIV